MSGRRRVSLAGGVIALAAAASMLGATAAVAAPSAPTSATAPASPTKVGLGPLDAACYTSAPAPVGMPSVKAGGRAGYYIWRDAASWHIRVTQPGHDGITYTGLVEACEQVHYATYLLAGQDSLLGSTTDPDVLGFTMSDYGPLDGFEFAATCPTTWTFSLEAGGQPVPSDEIFVGGTDLHPASNPFALSQDCPNEPVGTVNYGGSNGSLPSATEAMLKKLNAIALLALTNLGTFHSLDVNLTQRPSLFGDPGTTKVADATSHGSGSWWTGIGATAALVIEIALGVGVVVLFFFARRKKSA